MPPLPIRSAHPAPEFYLFFGFALKGLGFDLFYPLRSLTILVSPAAARMGAKPRDGRSGGEFCPAPFANSFQMNACAHLSRNK